MTSSSRAASPRSSRRQTLIKVAGELFHERAFDAVTTEMIGARAGVTGPALYRHFPSKQALLIAVLEDPLKDLLAHARETAAEVTDPRKALAAMIDYHVTRSLQNVPSTLVFLKNEHNVPEEERHRMRRMMRLYAEEWSALVERLRPDLSDAQNRVLTHAVFSMINSVPQFNSGLDVESVASTIRTAAVNALLVPAGTV
ncbi:helix-turn-helix transcriptional regulator [Amycolatopsis rubida]|uniref:DNA-binding transcriptional regulator, AcrR family n=1 Tax=Amycolatopsis rubida TaxID=112413 RepID=A0A1I5LJC5_9PSEU|nr:MULTISPECIES: TetR/AcrR family transcriptional regulator [Amycolatopsis]MYW93899.1 TetR family transcriptional regulator [Amycolatopsis rubida]NEC58888.1 helix-turn-helix transcriptional regulator [Amycolatopsis rubida]OAP25395.1 HTH-type transcriptional repressor KstR2 [Amycolatopsis sp. M39]SFO97272.1 DNA-binding transcriptional regulator, AcrR family [Amycolatopsis rubida]